MASVISEPILLSLQVALVTSLFGFVFGFPMAVWLARSQSVWSHSVESLLMLPVVFPPTVIGVLLLKTLGPHTPLGLWADALGLPLMFTPNAMVLGAWLVSLPFFVRTTQAALEMIPGDLLEIARLNGLSGLKLWQHVLLPLSWRGVLAGFLLMFIRAFGDFGVTLMVSGNIPHKTLNASVALYNAMMSGDTTQANTLLILTTALTAGLFIGVHVCSRRFLQQVWV